MASYRSTKLKVTIGYTLLLAILLFSLVFVHREMETLSAADDQAVDSAARERPEYDTDAPGIERSE